MDFIETVRAKRQKLADVLVDEEYSGIREIVEDLYPDQAHFIYELLQNAEDAGATEAAFELGPDAVAFVHDGRPFSDDDVWGITNIGKGAKKGQDDKIGRFGVGFKAVFVYSETPHVWSPTYSFRISDLVLPHELPARRELGRRTRFEFPFNNPKKPTAAAYAEVKTGLGELAETTLLFLSSLQRVEWQLGTGRANVVSRIQHSENHIELRKGINEHNGSSLHFLRFSAPVEGLPRQNVSIAFALEYLPNVSAYDPLRAISEQMRIAPVIGSVSVYFPAQNEAAGLRFHIHAPFVPELSRASVKDTPANQPLFAQLAGLAASSLHRIRDLGLLTGEFLGVLPNPQDAIPPRYQAVRSAIINEMNEKPLTPTHSKSHAPAKQLLQARAALKELVDENDLGVLQPHTVSAPRWAIGATQKNSNLDRFLAGLAIREWDISQFAQLLTDRCSEGTHFVSSPPSWANGPDSAFMSWLASKSATWHQQLYSLLYSTLAPSYSLYQLKPLRIVRLSNGSYSVGSSCYFPSDGVEHDEVLPRVDRGTYSSGKSQAQQAEAKKFLLEMGVREVGEAEQVESILRQRYSSGSIYPDINDMDRFIKLYEMDSTKTSLFHDYYIFKISKPSADNRWGKPVAVFLDLPYLDTGLTAYYEALGDSASRWPLSLEYKKAVDSIDRLRKFAEAVGVQTRLPVEQTSTHTHARSQILRTDYYGTAARWTSSHIDEDWTIPNIAKALATPSTALSRLLWKTLCESPTRALRARFRPNQQYQTREEPSSLVLLLRDASWVPQQGGRFVAPPDASRSQLPKGFPFDEGYEWLKAVQFGENERKRSEEYKRRQATARDLGFADEDSLQFAQWAAGLPLDMRQRLKADVDRRQQIVLPEQEPRDAARRAQRVTFQAAEAIERATEQRTRSVPVGVEEVKQQAEEYLRQLYTNTDGVMVCQICQDELPFKLDDGSYYVEKIEFLPGLARRHYQNYLALCPNHAAMFQHANGSRDSITELFAGINGNRLCVILAQQEATVYFTRTHIEDLRAVLQAETA